MCGLDAYWLSGAGEAGKKAFHSCGLPWNRDDSRSASLHCVCVHTLQHVNTECCICHHSILIRVQWMLLGSTTGLEETGSHIVAVSVVDMSGWYQMANGNDRLKIMVDEVIPNT